MTDGGRQMIRKRELLKQGGEHQSDDNVGIIKKMIDTKGSWA